MASRAWSHPDSGRIGAATGLLLGLNDVDVVLDSYRSIFPCSECGCGDLHQLGVRGHAALNVSLDLRFEARFVKARITVAIGEKQGIRAGPLLAVVAAPSGGHQIIDALVEGNGFEGPQNHALNPRLKLRDRQQGLNRAAVPMLTEARLQRMGLNRLGQGRNFQSVRNPDAILVECLSGSFDQVQQAQPSRDVFRGLAELGCECVHG